ncbi:MAG TPA: class I SAM-dependent methyltransferase [Pseudonocardiaceae bacterium]|nr:class I SAM-dependent methyltransferase [Pseudonocardiaceae bacterium]
MRGSLRDILPAQQLRRMMRTKLQRAIQEVVGPPHVEQMRELASLRQEVSELRVRLIEDMGELVRSSTERVIDHTRALEIRSRRDICYAGDVQAARESAEFARGHLAGARQFGHPHATLKYALSLAPVGGMALEFGVYTGTTLNLIATARQGGRVYGFDSFEGLPEHWRAGFAAGTFAADTVPDIPGAELVVGCFDEVLPGFMENHPGPVDFLHIDADLYSSASTVLNLVGPRLREGSVVVFDEFFNYPGWQEHEYRAWTEYVERTAIAFRYEAFTFDNEQVAVTLTSRPRRVEQLG